jgi:hypothetical protein
MKSYKYFFITLVALITTLSQSLAQLEVNSNVTPEEMVEFFIGAGISYSNVQYTGADTARGTFINGSTTNLGVNQGIALTSGTISYIPGPNDMGGISYTNNTNGDSLLSVLAGTITYDACILEFDFIPAADTAWCDFVFGSEEYPEWVGAFFNDVFGFFVTGPNPAGGNYEVQNIALIPGTTLPVSINNVNSLYYSEFYVDNLNGETIQYDGFTTVLTAKCAVVPGAVYHFKLAVADAGDYIFDTGVLLEGQSFKSQGPGDFLSFGFLSALNPGLPEDIFGQIENNMVSLIVPDGTDVTDLIASFETPGGVIVSIEGAIQQSGITVNDFSEPVNYFLAGINEKVWQVKVDIAVDIAQNTFGEIRIYPNPSAGKIEIQNISDVKVTIYSLIGSVVKESTASQHGNSVVVDDLLPGFYFVELLKDGNREVKKIQVN